MATWNAGRPDDLDAVRECWTALQPDVLVVIETGPASDAEWSRAFPGLTSRRLAGGMAVVTRGTVQAVESWPLARGHRSAHVRLALAGFHLPVARIGHQQVRPVRGRNGYGAGGGAADVQGLFRGISRRDEAKLLPAQRPDGEGYHLRGDR